MNRLEFKKHLFLVAFGVGFYVALQNLPYIWGILLRALDILHPVFLALCIAYILNLPMKFFEKVLFEEAFYRKKPYVLGKTAKKIKRPIALGLSILSFLTFIVALFFIIVPELIEAVTKIIASLPKVSEELYQAALNLSEKNETIKSFIEQAAPNIQKFINDNLNVSAILNTLSQGLSVAGAAGSKIMDYFLAVILAIYILLSKDFLIRQIKRMVRVFFTPRVAEQYIFSFVRLANQSFSSYITGQILDAIILGVMVMVSMVVLNIPYVLVVGVLMIIFALIPFVGAYISLVLGAFIILTVDPIKAFIFIPLVIVIQQIENNFIYPNIVGKSVSLPAAWVLISLIIGGALFGVPGMLIGVPTCAVLYALSKTYMRARIFNALQKNRNYIKAQILEQEKFREELRKEVQADLNEEEVPKSLSKDIVSSSHSSAS